MHLDNEPLSPDLWRILWRENAFQWLREKRQYADFDLDSCQTGGKGNTVMGNNGATWAQNIVDRWAAEKAIPAPRVGMISRIKQGMLARYKG